jgi:hypothetical protein
VKLSIAILISCGATAMVLRMDPLRRGSLISKIFRLNFKQTTNHTFQRDICHAF